jgi:hypothetical protein
VRSPETAARVWREAYGTLAAFPLRFVPG